MRAKGKRKSIKKREIQGTDD